MSFRSDFLDGAEKITPLLPAAATLAMATGIAGPAAGLSPLQTVAMSVALYFPSVMLAALELLEAGVPPAVLVLTSLVVGVRVVVLSLSIGPFFRRYSTGWKWALAYFLWTPVYALTVERFSGGPEADVRGFYLGMAVPLWFTVQGAVVAGTVFSATVPAGLQLGFVVPLAFIALLMRFLTTRPMTVTAVVAGVLAVLAGGIPFGLGVVVATLGGTVAGVVDSRRRGDE